MTTQTTTPDWNKLIERYRHARLASNAAQHAADHIDRHTKDGYDTAHAVLLDALKELDKARQREQ